MTRRHRRASGVPEVKKASTKRNRFFRIAKHKHLLPIVAAGGGLAAGPANAIELGDVMVQSRLGQPLRASIAFALAPNEELSDSCVLLRRSPSGLPGIGRATLRVTDGRILVSGQAPLREPMVAMNVVVNCPYTANLSRDYMMFIDPAAPASQVTQTTVATPLESAAAPAPALAAAPRAAAPVADRRPIGKSTRYQVQRGDSLSIIAQRIENRPVGLWQAVDAIHAANPDAFMDNDPNKLKAGSWLEIPSFDGSEPVLASAPAPTAVAPQVSPYAGVDEAVAETAAYEPPVIDSTPPVETGTPSAVESSFVEKSVDTTGDLRPGDIILDEEAVSAVDSIVIPDVELDGPETASSSPNVPTAVVDTSRSAPQSPWLLWFAGGGAAIIVALLLFGSRLRRRPTPLGTAGAPGEAPAEETESIEAFIDDEYDLDDDSPTAENLALDADMVISAGLGDGTDMEVAEIFGVAGPTEVDIELPLEPEASAGTMQTDIIPPVRTDEHSILESEILPDDDDYDMSVIVDATKMPQPEDVTERDLQAIEVSPEEDDATTDNYTIDREADFDILAQDYEDELSATQALNREIARAAAELEARVDEFEEEDDTSGMPLATVTELDVTGDEKTAEMPVVEDEDTVELDVEKSKVGNRNA